jgi:hypothetical protein
MHLLNCIIVAVVMSNNRMVSALLHHAVTFVESNVAESNELYQSAQFYLCSKP